MNTPTASFRLDRKTLKVMDRLITDPPPIIIDPKRGGPRNRTELVETLVKLAADAQAKAIEEAKERA